MASFESLEQLHAAREKRRSVYEKARAMRDQGQISEAEFQVLSAKFQAKMAELEAAEREFAASAPSAPGIPETPPAVPLNPTPAPSPFPAAVPEAGTASFPATGPAPGPGGAPSGGAVRLEVDRLPSEGEIMDLARGILGGQADPGAGFGSSLGLGGYLPGLPMAEDEDPFGAEGPPRGLEEMTDLAVDLGPESATPPAGIPTLSFGRGDGDLMSLVRGPTRRDEDSESLKIQLQSEKAARGLVERDLAQKAQEASDVGAALTRAIEEKDLAGSRAAELRVEIRELREKVRYGAAGAAGVGVLLLLFGISARTRLSGALSREAKLAEQVTALQAGAASAASAQARAQAAEAEATRLRTGLADAEARTAAEKGRAEDLAARVAELSARAPGDPETDLLVELADLRLELADRTGEALVSELEARGRRDLAELARTLPDRADPAPLARLVARLLATRPGGGSGVATSPAPGAVDEALGVIGELLRQGDREAAKTEIEATLAGELSGARSWIRLGSLAERSGEPERAREAYRKALTREPDHPGATVALSGLEIEEGDFGAARDLLAKAALRHPDNLEIQYNLALAFLGLEDRSGAAAALARLRGGGYPAEDVKDLEDRLAGLPEGTRGSVGG